MWVGCQDFYLAGVWAGKCGELTCLQSRIRVSPPESEHTNATGLIPTRRITETNVFRQKKHGEQYRARHGSLRVASAIYTCLLNKNALVGAVP